MDKKPLMIGTYTIATWDDMADAIVPTLSEEFIPALYALGADALYIFTNGQTGLWYVVEQQAQADILVATQAAIRERIFTRADIVDWTTRGNREDPARAELEALPLLELLKRGLVSKDASVEQATAATTELPPGILTGHEPGLELLEDDPHRTWFRPVAAWAEAQPEIRDQLGADFFLDEAWMVGANDVPTAIVVTSQAQKERLDSVNMDLITRGRAPFPAWGPVDFERYVGDMLVLFDPAKLARLATAVQRAIFNATHQGEQAATHRMVLHGQIVPLMGKAILSLLVAHELLRKSLFKCADDELALIQAAVGKLLLAAGSAAPFKAEDLPKPQTPPDTDTGGGQYL